MSGPPAGETSKAALRGAALAARQALSPEARAAASRVICGRVLALDRFARARAVALYAAIGAEVDPGELALAALARGKQLAFPAVDEGRRGLTFAYCRPEELVPGAHGTRRPPADAPAAPPQEIELVLVPGVAFDPAGNRLGRGRGHYDAGLAALSPGAYRVGLAFEVQLVPAVPREPHDVPLDAVVTEARTLFRLPGGERGGNSPG